MYLLVARKGEDGKTECSSVTSDDTEALLAAAMHALAEGCGICVLP